MIKAFVSAAAVLLAGAGAVGGPLTRGADGLRDPTQATAVLAPLEAEGTNSTPGVFALPQLGSAGFRCRRGWTVQPFFDEGSAVATEAVTIRAGSVTRRNFTDAVAGRIHGRSLIERKFSSSQRLALPSGHYRTATFTVHQGDEAREIDATVTAEFVAGTFAVRGVAGRLGTCYVKRWSVRMNVSPY
jgi:hypothetical protein